MNNLLLFVMSTRYDSSDYLNESIQRNAIGVGWKPVMANCAATTGRVTEQTISDLSQPGVGVVEVAGEVEKTRKQVMERSRFWQLACFWTW